MLIIRRCLLPWVTSAHIFPSRFSSSPAPTIQELSELWSLWSLLYLLTIGSKWSTEILILLDSFTSLLKYPVSSQFELEKVWSVFCLSVSLLTLQHMVGYISLCDYKPLHS